VEQPNVTTHDLFTIIGDQQVQIVMLRTQIAKLEQALAVKTQKDTE